MKPVVAHAASSEQDEARFLEVLDRATGAIRSAGMPFVVIGGIASAAQGRPRWDPRGADVDLFVRAADAVAPRVRAVERSARPAQGGARAVRPDRGRHGGRAMDRTGKDPPHYLIQRVREALAHDPRVGELELRVKMVGEKVFVTGTV